MRIYVAAPWTHKADAKRFAETLEAAGHTITKKWWEHREVPGYLTADIPASERIELEQQAKEDFEGVLTAEAFVLLNLEKSEGKAVETGMAITSAGFLANGVTRAGVYRFFLVGGKSNLFHYAPVWEDVLTPNDVIAALQ